MSKKVQLNFYEIIAPSWTHYKLFIHLYITHKTTEKNVAYGIFSYTPTKRYTHKKGWYWMESIVIAVSPSI